MLSPKLRRIMDMSFANTSWAKLQAHLRDPLVPFTLTHGDFHAGNMRFKPHESGDVARGRLFLFDWSEVGLWEPTADLGQMLISDVKPEVFKPHSRALVRAYWDRLQELGVREETYTFERCWDAFCRGGVEKWCECRQCCVCVCVCVSAGLFLAPPYAYHLSVCGYHFMISSFSFSLHFINSLSLSGSGCLQ